MPRALFLFLTNLALAAIAMAQNLVPNPSFEDTVTCTVYHPIIKPALHWYNVNIATPDIWDCDTVRRCGNRVMDPTDSGVQLKGYKLSYDGARHAGGFHWYGPLGSSTRDYLMAKLVTPLTVGVVYKVSMYYTRPTGHMRAIDHIGVYFSPDSLFEPTATPLPYVPQAELTDPSSPFLVDTNWAEIADTIVADGTEQWITFGTFEYDADVNGIEIPPMFPIDDAYYYLDMMSVEPLIGQSVMGVVVGVPILQANANEITCQGCKGARELMVYDASGRCVWAPHFENAEKWTVQVPTWLAGGAYIVSLTTESSQQVARFVKPQQ